MGPNWCAEYLLAFMLLERYTTMDRKISQGTQPNLSAMWVEGSGKLKTLCSLLLCPRPTPEFLPSMSIDTWLLLNAPTDVCGLAAYPNCQLRMDIIIIMISLVGQDKEV